MLDLRFVCDNIDKVAEAMTHRSGHYDVSNIRELDRTRRASISKCDALKAERNSVTAEIAVLKKDKKDAAELVEKSKKLGEEIKSLDAAINDACEQIKTLLLNIPNMPHVSVPLGESSDNNVEQRKFMQPTAFDFAPAAHWDIGSALDILDPVTAAKITGARFTVYKGLGARLERAIWNFMLDTHTADGYLEIFPPFMVNRASMTGTGQLPKFEEDAFAVKNTDYFLVPTAEVPVTNMHRDDVLDAKKLPIRYTAYTACFRAEAGSAGRDTRGLIRQHQFNKVEMVKFSSPETSYAELEDLTAQAEKILQLLKLPYRVVCLCTGDLGFCSAKTYDIEVWMPSYNRYVEISSCSNFEDFQARRLNVKYRDASGKLAYVHTLNGSGLAAGRTTAAILENYQNADGTVTIPDVLVPYMGGVKKIEKRS